MAQFPLIDQASLVMIPGAYKEGKIYSQLPTDGSGDFTYTRGTDTATRVNENGLIEKEYVNLLLYSNDFQAGSPYWRFYGPGTVTPNQEGYDGTNNASLIDATSFLRYTIAPSVGHTVSVYAKAGSVNWIRIVGSYFDLYNGEAPSGGFIEPVGNGWYRCSTLITTTGTDLRIYPSSGNGNNTSGSFYLQDSQLNPGLVAYPYLETTTVPVYAGLTDNMPRLDYTDATCPSLLLEPSRTNLVPVAEYGYLTVNVNPTYNDETSPEGVENGLKVTAIATNTAFIRTNTITTTAESTFSAFVKYGNNPWLHIINSGNSNNFFNFNCQTGEFGTNGTAVSNLNAEDYGNGWWRLSATFGHIGAGTIRIYLSSNSSTGFGTANTTVGNYFYNYGWQYEAGNYPTSYIPTYGSTQTRAAETTTSTFNSSSTGTISVSLGKVSESYFTVLGESFEANATRNDIAIAYSPTALKVSLNGAIVVNATGTYDTSSLSSLQLGHDNGSDQLGGGVENLIMFNDFLTDTELNAITV